MLLAAAVTAAIGIMGDDFLVSGSGSGSNGNGLLLQIFFVVAVAAIVDGVDNVAVDTSFHKHRLSNTSSSLALFCTCTILLLIDSLEFFVTIDDSCCCCCCFAAADDDDDGFSMTEPTELLNCPTLLYHPLRHPRSTSYRYSISSLVG